MSRPWRVNVFGVRHLSPAGAWHLRHYLDTLKPELVLIEGLADATELIPDVTRRGTRPPIALLAYTDSLPIRTLIYPLARYSPEFQAMSWADEHDAAFAELREHTLDLPPIGDGLTCFHDAVLRGRGARGSHGCQGPATAPCYLLWVQARRALAKMRTDA